MADHPAVRLELPVDKISIVRLHGEACFTCGTTKGPLAPAGYVDTGDGLGGVLPWAVVACPEHLQAAS